MTSNGLKCTFTFLARWAILAKQVLMQSSKNETLTEEAYNSFVRQFVDPFLLALKETNLLNDAIS